MSPASVDNASTANSGLPGALYRAADVRKLDALAIEQGGITGFELMQRAGRSAFRQALRRWPGAGQWLVFCGSGNNGGDGYVIAGLAALQGKSVQCVALADPERLDGDARRAYEWARSHEVPVILPRTEGGALDARVCEQALANADLVVDALLGTGLTGALKPPYDRVIRAINDSGKPAVAVDIPSGLCADTGTILGDAVNADLTVTFIGVKLGLLTGQGPDVVGTLLFDGLEVDASVYEQVPAAAGRLDWGSARQAWPRRRPTTHKGECGRVLVIGGDHGMGGAALLTAEAVARAGSGLVYVATRAEHLPAYLARRPELLVRAVDHRSELVPLLEQADAVIIGPGLGQQAWGTQMLQAVRSLFDGPVLADADALNLMAAAPAALPDNWVLTPHPGEAARLLGTTVSDIGQDRVRAVERLCQHYRAVVLLKGAGTLVGESGRIPTLIQGGNAGMATGGMGDVLSGLIGALMGFGLGGFQAATVGAALHGAAADEAARNLSMAGLLAGDIPLAAARLLATAEAARHHDE